MTRFITARRTGMPETTATAHVRGSVLALLFLSSLFCACSPTLPETKSIFQNIPENAGPPVIEGPGRTLSERESRRLLTRLKSEVKTTDILERHSAVMEAVSGTSLIKGNRAALLIDGPATYAAIFRAVGGAKDHINIETYIFENDEMGNKLADMLLQKQAEGVQVNLIYDSFGSKNTPPSFFQRLRDAGIGVVEFNPLNLLGLTRERRITHHDHRKILVVDGKIAITGGVNVSSVYSSRPSPREEEESVKTGWRDTDVEIEGPAVAEFQKLFIDTWKRQKGPELAPRNYFPPLKEAGNDLVRVVGSTPGDMNRITFIMYISAFTFAERSIHLTSAYFVPDDQTIQALTDAAKRGVDVKIIIPSVSDFSMAFYAGHYYYSELLEAGVKLYERRKAVLHAKTAVVDDIWSTVGSTNMDSWSFAHNDEVNAIILGKDFAVQMEKMFQTDLAESNEVRLEEWRKRPLPVKIKEWFYHLFKTFL